MGRANSFRAIVAGLTADEFQLPREAVDERRCRDEIGLGTLAEAAAAYRTDPECPGRRRRSLEGRLHHRRRPEVALPLLRQEVHLPHVFRQVKIDKYVCRISTPSC